MLSLSAYDRTIQSFIIMTKIDIILKDRGLKMLHSKLEDQNYQPLWTVTS